MFYKGKYIIVCKKHLCELDGIELDYHDEKEMLFELVESIKQKNSWKNLKLCYEDLPKPYWYIETQLTERRDSN